MHQLVVLVMRLAQALRQRCDLTVDGLFRHKFFGLRDRVAFQHDGLVATGAVGKTRLILDGAIAGALGSQMSTRRAVVGRMAARLGPILEIALEIPGIVGGGGERGGDLR
jgi:hypothetical protein